MSFNLKIAHENKLFSVHFNKVACPSGKYFIEVNSGDFIVASFEMQKDHFNEWKVTHPVPEWIIDLESQFAQAISKYHFLES